jgi:hypothetical protein
MVLGFVGIRDGGLTVTAYDKTVNADIEFTAAGTSFVEWADAAHTRKNLYHASDVLNAAAQKMGLGGAGNVPVLPDLYYNEFVGKSCRQIFEEASKVGGIWYVAQGSIVFSPFNASGSSFTPPAETDRTDIKYLGSKIISRAFVTDSYHNAVYEYGNTSAAWYSTVTVSGAYLIGSSMCAAAAGRIVGQTYHAWRVDKMLLSGLVPPGALYTQGLQSYPMLDLVVDFGATAITASCVSMCGQVGWVGLLIPHMCRMLFGNNHLSIVPASVSFGAVFMIIVDTLARSISAAEIPVSILTAMIGAPFFIVLMRRSGGWRI